jgi:hypothetical protein
MFHLKSRKKLLCKNSRTFSVEKKSNRKNFPRLDQKCLDGELVGEAGSFVLDKVLVVVGGAISISWGSDFFVI